MTRLLAVLLCVLLYPGAGPSAGEAGVVEGLQAPAWLEREGRRSPVMPGMALRAEDALRTGEGGRLLLRLAEGSQVKLGHNARLRLDRWAPPAKPEGLFSGLIRVAKGAFRFTTTLLSRPHRRALDIQVAAVTAGIRGTDLWGKAKDSEDIVCLIEGRITVERADERITMDQPLSFYVAPRAGPPKPVAPVSREQLAQWAAETELTPGEGIITGGTWSLTLASFRQPANASATLGRLREAGLPAVVSEVVVEGERWHRVDIPGFESRGEAAAFAARPDLAKRFPGAWVHRRRQDDGRA